MRRHAIAVLIAVIVLPAAMLGLLTAQAAPTGASRLVGNSCEVRVRVDGVERWQAMPADFCAEPATPTPAPTNTAVPPTATAIPPTPTPTMGPMVGACGEDAMHWHPPVVNGCATGHEHGAKPPAWVQSSQWMPMFDHPGNTPNENVLKHTAFKGFAFRDDGVDVYMLAHLDTHPQGQQTRFHSFQVWFRDATGAVSHLDYWLDFGTGDNALPNIQPTDGCGNNGQRPIIMVNFKAGCPRVEFENWYARAGVAPWMADVGFNVAPQYFGGPSKGMLSPGDLARSAEWLPTGQFNTNRRTELAWYANRSTQRGTFYSTQFGQTVSGPNDPLCGTPRTIGGKTYPTLCLAQYLSPTLTTVQFPGNAIQETYDCPACKLPN